MPTYQWGSPVSSWGSPIQYGNPFAGNADLASLQAAGARSKAAHAALIRSNTMQDLMDNDLLQSATDDELRNLNGPPRSERERRLQMVIQKDVSAKERGAALIPTLEMLQRSNARTLANDHLASQLANDAQNRYYHPLEFNLKRDQFANTQFQQDFGNAHTLRQEKFQRDRAYDEDYFKQLTADRAQSNLDRTDQRENYKDFTQLQKAVRSGEISAEDLIQAHPGFTPAQQAVLRGHQQAAAGDAQRYAAAAAQLNRELAGSRPPAVTAPSRWFGFMPGETTEPDPQEIAMARQGIIDKGSKNPGLFYDSEAGLFQQKAPYNGGAVAPFTNTPAQAPVQATAPSPYRSVIPVPTERQGSYQEGRVYVIQGVPHRYIGGNMVR